MPRQSTKIKRTKDDPVTKVAREIDLPQAQRVRGDVVLVDVVNFTDADQRHMVRQGKRQTLRKLTKIEKLHRAGILSAKEALACEWYHEAHSARYDVVCKVASWGGAAGAQQTNFDHLPKNPKQLEAYLNFQWARDAINPRLLPLFENVVLHGRPLNKLAISFRTAARELLAHIEGKVAL